MLAQVANRLGTDTAGPDIPIGSDLGRGDTGQARAHSEAKAQIQTHDREYLKNVAKEYNVQIDNRLDAPRENQAGRAPLALKPAEPERGPATLRPTRGPNRYAVIDQQNYADRAKEQANLNRENEQELARQQQRQRGPQR